MNAIDKIRQEARFNERISYLDREQARVERQMADLERRRQGIIQKINYEIRQLHTLQKKIVIN